MMGSVEGKTTECEKLWRNPKYGAKIEMFVLPVEQESILQVRDGQFLCGWRYDICVVASRISVWVAIQHLCGWQYSICVGGNTVSVWLAIQYLCGWQKEGKGGRGGNMFVSVIPQTPFTWQVRALGYRWPARDEENIARLQTSYLSQISQMRFVERKSVMWRKFWFLHMIDL